MADLWTKWESRCEKGEGIRAHTLPSHTAVSRMQRLLYMLLLELCASAVCSSTKGRAWVQSVCGVWVEAGRERRWFQEPVAMKREKWPGQMAGGVRSGEICSDSIMGVGVIKEKESSAQLITSASSTLVHYPCTACVHILSVCLFSLTSVFPW